MSNMLVFVSAEGLSPQFKRWKHLAKSPRLHFHFVAGWPRHASVSSERLAEPAPGECVCASLYPGSQIRERTHPNTCQNPPTPQRRSEEGLLEEVLISQSKNDELNYDIWWRRETELLYEGNYQPPRLLCHYGIMKISLKTLLKRD